MYTLDSLPGLQTRFWCASNRACSVEENRIVDAVDRCVIYWKAILLSFCIAALFTQKSLEVDQQECNVRKHLAGKRIYCSAGLVKTEQFQYYLQKGEGEFICVAARCL